MNEVILVSHPGDEFNDLVRTAIEIVKIKTVSHALIEFNECNVFIKKNSTEESVKEEYLKKLRAKF